MTNPTFNDIVTDERELREMLGEPASRSVLKERPALDDHFRAFIARSPFLLMATSGADGTCDVSPKGDAPGFVLVLDARRIAIPDRPGNKRFDGMKNLLANPHIGLIFVVPGRDETLRINGRAWITKDPDLLARCTAQGKTPQLAIGVEVEQCFLHCAKAFLRSKLWRHTEWPAPDALASMAQVLHDQIKPAGVSVQDYECEMEERNRTQLY
jgi:PPOX class probable FMN-dependent enzyme